jgi:hypothetical protein
MLKVSCTTCRHIGLAAAEHLPRQLTCSACGTSRRVEIAECARIKNPVAVMERILGEARPRRDDGRAISFRPPWPGERKDAFQSN